MQVDVLILSLAKNGQFTTLAEMIVLILLITYMLVITLIGWMSVSYPNIPCIQHFSAKLANIEGASCDHAS